MKELSIEEKAKRYDEAIEKLRSLHDDYDTVSTLIDVKEELENIFPELAESEDEGISREITEFLVAFNNGGYERPNENTIDSWLSWLEKQGEKGINGKNREIPFSEQKPAWSEEDERMLGKCIDAASGYYSPEDKQNMKDWLKSLKDRVHPKKEWSKEDEGILACIIGHLSTCLNEEAYKKYKSWLKSLKDRCIPLPKQEWSEGDENGLGDALWCCKQAASIAKDENDMGNIWYAENWLNSIKPQNRWKPSDEQMKALYDSIPENVMKISEREMLLNELYKDLKKLREE